MKKDKTKVDTQPERKFIQGDFTVKAVEGEPSAPVVKVQGYASTIDLDRDNEIILPTAFSGTVDRFMKNPIMFYGHETGGFFRPSSKPIGSYTKLEVHPSKGLWVEGDITALTEQGKEVGLLAKAGILKTFSVGFRPIKWEFNEETEVRTFTEVELYEISIVGIPANPEAIIQQAKEKGIIIKSLIPEKEETKMAEKLELKKPATMEELSQAMIELQKNYAEIDKKFAEATGKDNAMSPEHREAMQKILKQGEGIINNLEEMGKRFPKRDIVFTEDRNNGFFGGGKVSYADLITTPHKVLGDGEGKRLKRFQQLHDQITWANDLLEQKAKKSRRGKFMPVWDIADQPISDDNDGRKALKNLVREWNILGNELTSGELEKALSTGAAAAGLEFVPTMFSADLKDQMRAATVLAGMLVNFDAPSDPWKFPVAGADIYGVGVAQTTA
ncbi:MAG: HK97 family phage prohead protease, partial [Nitrospira sp.]|nr:HK97 family phage prohead protease [Nitrospira sp.]